MCAHANECIKCGWKERRTKEKKEEKKEKKADKKKEKKEKRLKHLLSDGVKGCHFSAVLVVQLHVVSHCGCFPKANHP